MVISRHEIRKLFAARTAALLLLLLAVNVLLQLYLFTATGEDGYTQKAYSDLWHEISTMEPEDVLPALEEARDSAEKYSEITLYGRVYEEAEAVLTYDAYLESIAEKAGDIALMGRLSGGNAYALRNAEKTAAVYARLKGITPVITDPTGVLAVTDNALTDAIAVLMLFIVAVNLLFAEKNEKQLNLLRSTPKGRRPLMRAKSLVMAVAVVLLTVALYGTNALLGRLLYGAVDLTVPVQSIALYRSCPYALTVGGFLAGYFAVSAVSLVLLGFIFMAFSAAAERLIFVFAASAAVVILETVCYTQIPATSHLATLKYLNVIGGVRSGACLADYVNLNIAGRPVSALLLYGVCLAAALVLAALYVIRYLDRPRTARALPAGRRFFPGAGKHTCLFLHECVKLLLPGGGAAVIVLLVLVTIWWNPAMRVQFDSLDEVYYKAYTDELCGPADAEKLESIERERETYEQLGRDISADLASGKSEGYIQLKYKEELLRQQAFDRVAEQAEYLRAVPGGWFFYAKGYEILTDPDSALNRDLPQALLYVFALIALAFGIVSVDYRNEEVRLLRTTVFGRRRLTAAKCALGVLCAAIAFAAVYLVRVCRVLGAYGTAGLAAPAASMAHLSTVPAGVTVWQYLLLILAMRFAAGVLVVGAVFILMRKMRNGIAVLALGAALFVLPLILAALEMPGARWLLCNPLLLGHVF